MGKYAGSGSQQTLSVKRSPTLKLNGYPLTSLLKSVIIVFPQRQQHQSARFPAAHEPARGPVCGCALVPHGGSLFAEADVDRRVKAAWRPSKHLSNDSVPLVAPRLHACQTCAPATSRRAGGESISDLSTGRDARRAPAKLMLCAVAAAARRGERSPTPTAPCQKRRLFVRFFFLLIQLPHKPGRTFGILPASAEPRPHHRAARFM